VRGQHDKRHLVYPYVTLKITIISDNMNTIAFATIIGQDKIITPYINHENTPVQNITYIFKLISFVDFVFHICITCGRNAIVVNDAAINPITVTRFTTN
jgi:hypothetical protein|tara:strand:+ start:142 stop:438 length:297 start_codon:yes stop_codon:yes gene_type:complete